MWEHECSKEISYRFTSPSARRCKELPIGTGGARLYGAKGLAGKASWELDHPFSMKTLESLSILVSQPAEWVKHPPDTARERERVKIDGLTRWRARYWSEALPG